ncbi:MAG: FMN-dependent NADH-azoreductase [Kiritimatiellia bacterium]|jgi:FMN-dependent NADH-azoreductase
MKILHILANPKPTEDATSKQIAAKFFMKIAELGNEDTEVVNVDLYQEPPPPLSFEQYRNFWYPVMIDGYVPTKEDITASHYAITQAEKVLSSDVLVISMPMWNYSIPGIVKSWLDHVFCPGLLYDMTSSGYKPKHSLKQVILLVSSDEVYKEGDPRDALSPAINAMFEGIGIEDISFAWADGQSPLLSREFDSRKNLAFEMAEELAEEIMESQPA